MVRIGNLDLGETPRIAVPLTDLQVDQGTHDAARWADIFELRVDLFTSQDPGYVVDICRQVQRHRKPIIVTVRHPDQGGGTKIGDPSRLEIFAAIAPYADAFDIETRATIADRVIDIARETSTIPIASHHDFEATPADTDLHRLFDESINKGAAITKIAATANTASDRNRLLDLLRDRRSENSIVIAMGPHGRASRVFFPLCGSLVTYGFLTQAVAPGQMSIRDLRYELARYCPGVAAEIE